MTSASFALSRRRALHPQRKRKFFADLAQLLNEDPPEIRPLQGTFFGPELPADATNLPSSSQELNSASQTPCIPSRSLTGDSFESVEFDAPRTRASGVSNFGASQQSSSHNESMADSMLFLPSVIRNNSQKRKDQHVHFEFDLETKSDSASNNSGAKRTPLPVTTLINSGLMLEKPPANVHLELADYYDVDRMCELSPCWLQSNGASCDMHQGPLRRPMLLFCIQALDEFIARSEWLGQQHWRVQACKLARRVFTAMWEGDVLGAMPSEPDILLSDYVSKKSTLAGVALGVWHIIARYWDKYKQNYLHQLELYFTDVPEGESTLSVSKWDQLRGLLNIYGMKQSQAFRLVEQQGGDQFHVCELTEKMIRSGTHGLPSIEHLRVGMEYLGCNGAASNVDSTTLVRRPMISQQDGKTAFKAILIHLTNWNEEVQVFPCGSFSRGAAFISVLDILVAVPTPAGKPDHSQAGADASAFEEVVAALATANVIQKGAMRQLSRTRGACIIPFKNSSILLDLKVYCPPRSWFALLYFTGPEDFVLTFYVNLLNRSLREIPDTTFECIYASVAEALGQEALLEIASEKDLFDIVGQDYVPPTDRV
ncbi:DNA polymerase beta [Phytophthora nicotianae]|uniref:DNA polymerase n=2 Tax=Phytophthora nicotianae TaxID=4792 RepID=A0A0W8BY06_PHYNI|nr:DNA polymerase beta [Phytophthora nicotianae]